MPPAASFSDEGASSPLLGDAAAVLSINDTVLNITGAIQRTVFATALRRHNWGSLLGSCNADLEIPRDYDVLNTMEDLNGRPPEFWGWTSFDALSSWKSPYE